MIVGLMKQKSARRIFILAVLLVTITVICQRLSRDVAHWEALPDNLRSRIKCAPHSDVVEDENQGRRFPQRHSQNLTIVSAYINLGSVPKGIVETRNTAKYLKWATVFGRLDNALVFYTDSSEMKTVVENSRRMSSFPTRVIEVEDRNKLWAFGLKAHIQAIFSNLWNLKAIQPEKYADYSSSQHAKYEFMEDAISRDFYHSEYYAWLDVGYFRDIVHLSHHFTLEIPCNFNSSKIAFNVVDRDISLSSKPADIMLDTQVWIGGGFFFGRKSVMLSFAKQYRRAVEAFIAQGIINTDQQVIFSLFSDEGRNVLKPSVHIQLYVPDGDVNEWFYLGYLCMKIKEIVNQRVVAATREPH
ncbi:uncharacterized protein LOC135482078 [Liolophura sinensis]|uniref:uncharacterized protein LOC135482078 n=1 Tax=Liolophura sinensis TaxID=3198878 RepID=UPI003158094A